jgi:hypothetical protein
MICSGGVCVVCGTDADCATTQHCYLNQCLTACQSDNMCKTAGEVCDTANSVCVDCNTNADCHTGQYCSSNTCTANLCQPGSSICYGNAVFTCNTSGSGYGAPVNCGAEVCAATGTTASCVDGGV